MKKTLRLGDLLYLDEPSIRQRLRVILDSKNEIMTKLYGQKPLAEEECLQWCQDQARFFANYICDTGAWLEQARKENKNILFEAQLGAMRDIDSGIYPYTSSSNTLAAYAPLGAGMTGVTLDHVVGVMKAYSTCVGAGPFAAEKAMPEEWNEVLRKVGAEYGAATGRPRRVGPFDAVASRYGLRCQKADKIALTKLDVLSKLETIPVIDTYRVDSQTVWDFPINAMLEYAEPVVTELPGWNCDISGCRSWEELPENAQRYVTALEEMTDCHIDLISVGADREACFPTREGSWF